MSDERQVFQPKSTVKMYYSPPPPILLMGVMFSLAVFHSIIEVSAAEHVNSILPCKSRVIAQLYIGTWFREICSCPFLASNNKFHQTTYQHFSRSLYNRYLLCGPVFSYMVKSVIWSTLTHKVGVLYQIYGLIVYMINFCWSHCAKLAQKQGFVTIQTTRWK